MSDTLFADLILLYTRKEFDPSQPRDETGKWTDSGGGSSGGSNGSGNSGGDSSGERVAPYIMQDSPTANLNKMVIEDAHLPDTHTTGLQEIKFVEQSFVAAHVEGQVVEAYGIYNPQSSTITLSSNADNIALIGGAVVLHETGHHVHMARLTDEAAKQWGDLSKNGESCHISAYGRTNQGEHFAEAYRLYARGGTYRAKLRKAEPNTYRFMAGVFNGKHVFPVGERAMLDWGRYDPKYK